MYNTMLDARHLKPMRREQNMGDIWDDLGNFATNVVQATADNIEEQAPQLLAQQIIASNVPGYKYPVPVAVRPVTPVLAVTTTPPAAATVTVQPGMVAPQGFTQLPGTKTAIKSVYLYSALAVVGAIILLMIIKKRG